MADADGGQPTALAAPSARRRQFLKTIGCLTAGAAGTGVAATARPLLASASAHGSAPADPMGVLVDMTACIGCRLCEYACRKANGIEAGDLASYDDQSVFACKRRPQPDALTVVNAWDRPGEPSRPVYAKLNCMHCNHAACVSACIVGALQKQENGAVTYDAWKCIGCRYCMVACPFQLPTYEYDDVLTPEVRKCQFCHHERISQGQRPACVEECPRQAMTYGKRSELIAQAHRRIAEHPQKYVDHVYGEHEVGGTSWMYISDAPVEQAGFLTLGQAAPPALTEAIQHGVFKYWIAPVGWYSFLAAMYWLTGRKAAAHIEATHGHAEAHEQPAALRRHAVASAPAKPVPALVAAGGGSAHTAVIEADSPEPPIHEAQTNGHAGNGRHGAAEAGHAAESHHEHADHDDCFRPIERKLLTPGVWALIALVVTGVCFWLYRFVVGLAATTNLDQQHPWGLWIAMDVGSGIALAGGGFVTAALAHVFHRHHYHTIARSALLTALLGYTFYVPGLLADIGRWYNIWHPTLPNMWQGNSVLFEVGICVMLYLNVQYAELAPIICQRLLGESWMARWPRLRSMVALSQTMANKMLPALLVLGVCLSTFHQSSLGNLMVIAPYKLHELWWTPVSPLLFLLSAMMVGFPMVIFTILFASWSLRRQPEMHVLGSLGGIYVPIFLSMYLVVKVVDVLVRGVAWHVTSGSYEGVLWAIEVLAGVIVPLVMLLMPRVRRSPRLLGAASLLVILGVVLNRLNVFVLAYHPPYSEKNYFPSVTEFAVSMGLVAALLLVYRIAVTYLPILEPRPLAKAAA